MDCRKNGDIIKLIFKMKDAEKIVSSVPQYLKYINIEKSSVEDYNRCFNIYQEASSYFFQSWGFLKSQYFEGHIPEASKNFLANNLCSQTIKKFMELKQSLESIKIEEIYKENLERLGDRIENINSSLNEVIVELGRV